MSKSSKDRQTLDAGDYVSGVLCCDRAVLARAITLIESRNPQHQQLAQEVLQQLLPKTGNSTRLGISGVPGVGKSTFIEALGVSLTGKGHKVAVLAVDPSSTRTGGSILGDKTRMQDLATDPNAYIRPSPTSGTLGGVTRVTRETILLCEAAGFDTIIVETVGVGQSEVSIAAMVDFFLLLMLPGAGDELQGIKKGVLEIADMIAVNKADPENTLAAEQAAGAYRNALHILTPVSKHWTPPVVTCSALHKTGIKDIWQHVTRFRQCMVDNGEWQNKRNRQQVDWMWALIEYQMLHKLRADPEYSEITRKIENDVRSGKITPVSAAESLLQLQLKHP